jgi:hypothetical protein
LDSEERQVGIATVPDPITKRPCILWQDIQDSFPRLSHIRAGREHVFCVFDENLVEYVHILSSFPRILHVTR